MILVALLDLLALALPLLLVVRLLAAPFSADTRAELKNHPLRHVLLVVFTLFLWFAPWGIPLGYLAAQMDSLRGTYRLNSTPFLPDFKTRRALARILHDRYGIPSATIHGCLVVNINDILFESAYDRVMLPAIQKHFGRDIIEECKLAAISETVK